MIHGYLQKQCTVVSCLNGTTVAYWEKDIEVETREGEREGEGEKERERGGGQITLDKL